MTPDFHLQGSGNDRHVVVAACYADCYELTQRLGHSLNDHS